MSDQVFTVADAAYVVNLPQSHIRSWVQRSMTAFTAYTGNRRIRFDLRALRCLALMRELTNYGVSPNIAATQAVSVVDRARDGWPISAVFSRDPQQSPAIVPQDALPAATPLIIIPLIPLFAEIDRRIQGLS